MPIPLLGPGHPLPSPLSADGEGLVAVTTDLSADRLVDAYSRGIFPWFDLDGRYFWYSPDPRMVLLPGEIRISRRLRRTFDRGGFDVRMDTAFDRVTEACASVPRPEGDTWISPSFREAYGELHRRGLAHSVESWRDEELVGGLYGVSLGAAFMGESMFSLARDASKIALLSLVGHLRRWGFVLIDCQVHSPHLESLGATLRPRPAFLALLADALSVPARPGPWRPDGPSPIVLTDRPHELERRE